MADKTKFLDYEPVTPSRDRRRIDEKGTEGTLSARVAAHRTLSSFMDDKPEVKTNDPKENVPRPSRTSTRVTGKTATFEPVRLSRVLKHGHAPSFAGVLLFTLILYFRPYEFSPSLAWLSSSAFWIAILTIAIFVPTQLGLEGNLTARPREVNLLLLLTLVALISVPFALSPAAAWSSFTEYLKVVMVFVVMVNVIRTERRLKALVLVALAASCLLSLAALNDYRLGHLALAGTRISGTIGGMFANPNDLALHLVTMTPLAIGLLLATRSILMKLIYALSACLSVLAIVATFSRGGVLGLAATGFVLVFKLVPKLRIAAIVLFVLLLLAALAVVPGAFRERLFDTRDASVLSRTDDLKRSIYLAIRHPFAGVGMSNFVLYSNQAKATHNAYTQVASEIGLAGLAFYVMFLVSPLKRLRRIEGEYLSAKRKPRVYYLVIGLQAALIGYMVSSFFASVAFHWYAYYLVAYAVALWRIHEATQT